MKIIIEQKTMSDGSITFSISTEKRTECFVSTKAVSETSTSVTFDSFVWACEMMAMYTKSLLMEQHPDRPQDLTTP